MRIKSLYPWLMIFIWWLEASTENIATSQKVIAPKLLPQSVNKPTILLADALKMALDHHVKIKLAQNRREQSQAEKWSSIGLLMPKLSLIYGYTHNIPDAELAFFDLSSQLNLTRQMASVLRKSGDNTEADTLDRQADLLLRRGADKAIVIRPKHVIDGKLALEIPLFHGESLGRVLAAYENASLFDAKLHEEKAETVYLVAQAYFLAWHLSNVLAVRERALDLAQEFYKTATDQRGRKPTIINKDFLVAQANFFDRQADKQAALLDYRSAVGELGLAMGMSEEFRVADPDPMIFSALNTDGERLFAIASANRADLRVGRQTLRLFEKESQSLFLGFLPNFGLRADVNYTSNERNITGENFTYALSINARWSLFDGGIGIMALKKLSLKKQESEIAIRDLESVINAKIRGHQERLDLLHMREIASQLKLEAFEEASLAAYGRYQRGLISLSEFLESEDKRSIAELNYKSSQFDLLSEKLAFSREAGLLTPEWGR